MDKDGRLVGGALIKHGVILVCFCVCVCDYLLRACVFRSVKLGC